MLFRLGGADKHTTPEDMFFSRIFVDCQQVAKLAGSKQATCIAIISGCLNVSAIMTTFMQVSLNEQGLIVHHA